MSAVDTTGIGLAVGRLLTKTIHDVTFETPSLVGALMGLDAYYAKNAPGSMPRIRKGKVGGGVVKGKMKTNFLVGKPKWTGVDAMDPVLANRALEMIKRVRLIQGGIMASAMQFGEPIDKFEVAILEDEEELNNWVQRVTKWAGEGYIEEINTQLWPTENQVGGQGQSDGNIAKLQAFAYSLQSGFAGNEAAGNGQYLYMGIDLNQYPALKAMNSGTDAVPFVYTWENMRAKFAGEMKGKRGSKMDLAIHGTDTFNATRTQQGATLRQNVEGVVNLPGEWFQTNDGTFHLLEPGIDLLPYREVYWGDSRTLAVGLPDNPAEEVDYIDPWPGQPTMVGLQGFSMTAFVNENPRMWARAYHVTLP